MPVLKYRSRTLTALSALVPEIVYVMCGARGESNHRLMRALPQTRFIGFEPDPVEHARLTAHQLEGFRYFATAVGGRDERRTLYVTHNPACSSLLRPDHALVERFQGCAEDLAVERELSMDVVSLESFLPKNGVSRVDFLDLDTQGTELEILQGASQFLSTSVVGVKCEVEFCRLYQDQPLFGDIDAYLRSLGFMVFDLQRSRYRRAGFPPRALTRGQLLWGDAIFLRNHAWFSARSSKPALFRLCLLAAHLQFHDYALEVLDALLRGDAGALTPEESAGLASAREQYLKDLARSARWQGIVQGLEAVGLGRPLKFVGRLAVQAGERLRKDRVMTESNWSD